MQRLNESISHNAAKGSVILGTGEKSSPQETKGSISFSAYIADMRIPFF